ncbi:MAG: sigma factor-like helix-turn-helix DNA-binding protein [Lachnospiraceae bacterium]|jgi:RNA polymerase sigma-70 factor (ECF subfamily)
MAVIVRYDEPWIQIFQKHCFEEQTFAEIAEVLKLSEGTVKTRYYKMLAQIRKEVADNE